MSPFKDTIEGYFPFPHVGYVSPLEGTAVKAFCYILETCVSKVYSRKLGLLR